MQNKHDRAGRIELSEESVKAFEQLKGATTTEPIILHYPDWSELFEIHTDASQEAVAAILCQRIDGRERVIMYASKALAANEKSIGFMSRSA